MLKTILGEEGLAYATPIFQYLFGNINKYTYRDSFEDRAFAKELWAKVEASGYILKNCKLFLYANHKNSLAGLPTSPARFEIAAEDVRLLRSLRLKLPKKYKVYSLFDFSNLEGALLWSREMRNYIGKFINKKLRFLYSYGLTYSEIESQLVEYALWVLRKHYPVYETDLHAKNICKTAVHNMGMLLIQHWTRGKRQVLNKETDGTFQHRFVQLDYASEVHVRPEHENRELAWDLQTVLKTLDKRHASMLSALSGTYDAGVTLFIGVDNSEAASQWSFERYLAAVATYHGVGEQEVSKLLADVRMKFGGVNS